jgi:hypothetical protein
MSSRYVNLLTKTRGDERFLVGGQKQSIAQSGKPSPHSYFLHECLCFDRSNTWNGSPPQIKNKNKNKKENKIKRKTKMPFYNS